MGKNLNEELLKEIFYVAIRNKGILSILSDNLEESYLPNQEYQNLFRRLKSIIDNDEGISFGILFNDFDNDDDVVFLLEDIQEAGENLDFSLDSESGISSLLGRLEDYIKKSKLLQVFEIAQNNYNKGEIDEVVNGLKEYAEVYSSLSLRGDIDLKNSSVFAGFEDRYINAKIEKALNFDEGTTDPIRFGIKQLDDLAGRNGVRKSDVACFLAGSGFGKTKCLRYVSNYNARVGGKNVLHIQLEGSRREAFSGYDATWTGVSSFDHENGLIESSKLESLSNLSKKVDGEIYMVNFEKFGTATTSGVIKAIEEYRAKGIIIDLVVIDYLECLDPSNRNKRGADERIRRAVVADELKNIAIQFDIPIITATQSGFLPQDQLNDPNFVLSRYNVGEAKGIIKPMSWLISLNMTRDEKDSQMMRLYVDKSRHTRSGDLFTICTDYERDRFYDHKRTEAFITDGVDDYADIDDVT